MVHPELAGFLKVFINRFTVDISIWTFLLMSAAFLIAGLYQIIRRNRQEDINDTGKMDSLRNRPGSSGKWQLGSVSETINHYKGLVEHASEIIYRVDLQGRITYVNPAVTRILGYGEQQLIGKNYLKLISEDYRDEVDEFYTKQLRQEIGETYYEFEAKARDGESIWFGQNVRLLRKDGRLVGFQAIARNISSRLEAERQLKNREMQLRLFVKHTPAAVAMLDRNMRYIITSDRWLEDFRIEQDDIEGKSHYDIFPTVTDEWKEIYKTCLSGVSEKSEEDLFVRADGEPEWIKWEIHPWRELSGEVGGIIIFTELITDRKKTEKALKVAKEEAEEASRAKTNFIRRMSHEFRTPLTSILGFAEMLDKEKGIGEEHNEYLQHILRSGRHLVSMVDDILSISKFESGKIEFEAEEFGVKELMEKCMSTVVDLCRQHNNEMTLWIDDQVPDLLKSDRNKLELIFKNLIENSCKFTDDGTISIKATYNPVPGTGADGLLTVLISDTGIGIPREKSEYIFRPFTQVGERYNEGTGLGLALVRRLCRFLGGEIKLDSVEGKGTNVFVNVPVQVCRLPVEAGSDQEEIPRLDEPDEASLEDVGAYIESLDKKTRDAIFEALELQNIDLLANIDQHFDLPADNNNGALLKLKQSARDYDYYFITELYKILAK